MIHRKLGVFEQLFGALRLVGFAEHQADRTGQENLAVAEGDRRPQGAADRFGKCGDAGEILFRQQEQPELIAGQPRQSVLRLDQSAEPARQRQQDGIADGHADRVVDLLEAIEVDDHDGRADGGIGLGEAQHRVEAIEEQFAIGQAGEIVMYGVVQQPLFGGLDLGHVGERADEADHLAVGADHRPRFQRKP